MSYPIFTLLFIAIVVVTIVTLIAAFEMLERRREGPSVAMNRPMHRECYELGVQKRGPREAA